VNDQEREQAMRRISLLRTELERHKHDAASMQAVVELACHVADAWAKLGCKPPSVTANVPLWGTLDALERATRSSPLRKAIPPKLCLRCADDGNDVPATDGELCAACHDTLGELQDERNAR